MIWPFRKKTKADAALAVMDDAINLSSLQWQKFTQTLKFKDGAPLRDVIFVFAIPMFECLRKEFSELNDSPDSVLLLFIAKGIEKSNTHTTEQIETALSVQLP